ncbi:MAG: hypothetical protein WC005_01405 [Candidatus Nanopelagicales bacterium]
MIIDCEQCTAVPAACGDCVVSVLIGMPDSTSHLAIPVIADEHVAAVTVLAESGLIPPLRLVNGGGSDPRRVSKRQAG